jgi:hypothetical protein
LRPLREEFVKRGKKGTSFDILNQLVDVGSDPFSDIHRQHIKKGLQNVGKMKSPYSQKK